MSIGAAAASGVNLISGNKGFMFAGNLFVPATPNA